MNIMDVLYQTKDVNVTDSTPLEVPDNGKIKRYIAMSVTVFLCGIFLVIVNTMVILAPFYHKGLRKKTFIFVSSLAVSDITMGLCHGIARIMGLIRVLQPPWFVASNEYCKSILFFNYFSTIASITNLLLICVERYIAIVHSVKYESIFSANLCVALLSLVWISAFGLSIITAIFTRKGILICHLTDQEPLAFHLGIGLIIWMSIAVMTFMYFRMFIALRRSYKLRSAAGSGLRANTSRTLKSKISVTKMLFTAFGIFVLCYVPHLTNIHLLMEQKMPLEGVFITYVISLLNSCMNFFIYVVQSRKYRYAFRMMCCGPKLLCSQREDRDVTETSVTPSGLSITQT